MGRTFIRQVSQIQGSDTYDDTLAAGSTLESNAADLEADLNGLRSQVEKIIDNTGNWYDALATVNSKQRSLKDLNTDLDDIEEKRLICPVQVLTNITVPASQNYVVLSQAGAETPSDVAAVDGGTALGAIVATLAGDVGTAATTEVAGSNALSPKNLVIIRDATTKDAITSSNGYEIFGLIQAENGVIDGDAFNDIDHQVQISFVENDGSDDLTLVAAGDIENKVIEYVYGKRITLDTLPEQCSFPPVQFSDQVASVDVTLDNAIDNQGATVATQDTNISIKLDTAGVYWEWQDDLSASLFRVTEGSAGGTSDVTIGSDVDTYNNNAIDVDFDNGISVDTGAAGTTINIGVTANQIDAGGVLSILSGGGADLSLAAALELNLTDSYRAGSTWSLADGIALANSSAEWSAFETAFGEVSLLNAIEQAKTSSSAAKYVAVLTAAVPADTNVTGAGGSPNLDAQLGDYSGVTFVDDVDVFLNGVLLRNGANAAANNDVYPGDTPADGDLKFEFAVTNAGDTPDVITMMIRGG